MSTLFCCASAAGYRPQYLQHQQKFTTFINWASFPRAASPKGDGEATDLSILGTPYVVQLVRQVNYGPLESKRYFAFCNSSNNFVEVVEDDLIRANFQKLNSYVPLPLLLFGGSCVGGTEAHRSMKGTKTIAATSTTSSSR